VKGKKIRFFPHHFGNKEVHTSFLFVWLRSDAADAGSESRGRM
jgi:hypothetical protein